MTTQATLAALAAMAKSIRELQESVKALADKKNPPKNP